MAMLMDGVNSNTAAPYAEVIGSRLEQDYGELLERSVELLDDAQTLPSVVDDSADVATVADMVIKMRDAAARAESHRKAEGEPYLRGKAVIDAFFCKRIKDPLDVARKDLSGRLDAHKQRQLAAERARREAEAAAARKLQEEARRKQEEAEAAAQRARAIETVRLREAAAAKARADANLAMAALEEKTLATMDKPGRMVGERFEGPDRSGQVTMRKTSVVYIEAVDQLDLELLRPYLKEEHLLMALRAWAKATNYEQPMPGAVVSLRDATVVR